ncbi:MAG: hypothetical protein KZQ80_13415 [Candidatus Thiodiazotropha sp. (ex Monitilora ramsayi)]|nr:hypothetical protein [Candidatus Thiodiazotropha sp. (ex Monitilora ramsayi)]
MFDIFTHRNQAAKQTIFFVPEPDPFENPLVEIDPGQLRQWATALPFANPEQLSEAMITSLGRLNRFPGQVKRRDELVEIYHTPALRIAHGTGARKNTIPKELLRRVMLEMAYAYSQIANDCLRTKASRKNLDRLAKAIYYSIKFYLLEYLYACESFDCRAGHTYREITRLRTYAEEQKVHQIEIDDSDNSQEPGQATIAHQFNRFLLLRLLDPCHLQEGEPRICYEYLNTVASHAAVQTPTQETEQSGHYVIDRLGEVQPHLYEPEGLENLSQPRFALFNLNPVSLQIHQLLRGLERSVDHKPPAMTSLTTQETTNLLARMLKSWHIRPKRDSERHSTSGHVELWTGLHHIHQHLARPDREMASENEEITMTSAQSLSTVMQSSDKPQLLARRFNQSRSGVALHLPLSACERELIGELVLISLHGSNDPSEWKIGIVKRALNREEGVLEIGVQFLTGNIMPITLQPVKKQSDEESDEGNEEIPNYPGLYIDQGHSHRSSLIVPKRFFIIGQEYRVEEMIPAPDITPLQLLENTAMFERYRVKSC